MTIQPAYALQVAPRDIKYDTVKGTSEAYPDGKFPVLGDKYKAIFYFNIQLDDIKGDLLSSKFKRLESNIPSSEDSGAMELFNRRIDRYTMEHDIEVYTNKPVEKESDMIM